MTVPQFTSAPPAELVSALNAIINDINAAVLNGTAPVGTAGGDLTGTYPNPTVGAGAITTTKIGAAAVNLATQVTGILPVANFIIVTTVALLPVAPSTGTMAFATNGLKTGEATGHGTGVPVYYSSGWRVFSDDSPVLT